MFFKFKYAVLFLLILTALPDFAQTEAVEYKKEMDGELFRLSVKNLLPTSLQYSITCDTVNIEFQTLLPPYSDFVEVLVIPGLDLNDSSSIGHLVKVTAKLGNPTAIHYDSYLYQLPYARSKSYEVMQSFKGKFSHRSESSMFAIDFKMSPGEAIHAARDGIVCYVEEHRTEGGNDREKYISKGNRIVIMHDDRTLATYMHLNPDGAVVEIGETVERGQHIGYSGNTGFTSKPHLHFVVRSGEKSVPIKFEGYKKIKKGKIYSIK